MKKGNIRPFIIIAGVLVLILLVIGGTAASVLAYRQFAEPEQSDAEILPVIQQQESDSVDISEKGVLVTQVDPESPAALAGLHRGSIILEVDGEEVNTPQELRESINQHEAGETISLTVLICDEPTDLSVTLASSEPYLGVSIFGGSNIIRESKEVEKFLDELPEGSEGWEEFFDELPKGFEGMPHFFGAPSEDFRGMPFLENPPEGFDDLPHFFDELPEDFDFSFSVMIFDIVDESPADLAGLEKGDIITAINGQDVSSQDEVIDAITSNAPGDEITVTVQRGDESLDISVILGEHPDNNDQAYLGVYLGSGAIHREFRFSEDEQNS